MQFCPATNEGTICSWCYWPQWNGPICIVQWTDIQLSSRQYTQLLMCPNCICAHNNVRSVFKLGRHHTGRRSLWAFFQSTHFTLSRHHRDATQTSSWACRTPLLTKGYAMYEVHVYPKCAGIFVSPHSRPVPVGPVMHTGGTLHLHSDQDTCSWSRSLTDPWLVLGDPTLVGESNFWSIRN